MNFFTSWPTRIDLYSETPFSILSDSFFLIDKLGQEQSCQIIPENRIV